MLNNNAYNETWVAQAMIFIDHTYSYNVHVYSTKPLVGKKAVLFSTTLVYCNKIIRYDSESFLIPYQ